MTEETKQLLSAVLKLPVEARAALAGSLLESLDNPIDENVEAAWADEIGKRMAEIDGGFVRTVPWEKARRRIAGQ
jgi:putative addiction module component (TIGR02574 family)